MFSFLKHGLGQTQKIFRRSFKLGKDFPLTRPYSCENQFARCKVAVVTGGGDRLGLTFASLFLKSGARNVVIVDSERNDGICDLMEKYGNDRVEFYALDVTDRAGFSKMFKYVMSDHGQLDYLVNNLNYFSIEQWQKIICINNYGMILSTFLGMQTMKTDCKELAGTIINVGNIAGLEPFFPSPVYSGAYHFLLQFTRSLGHNFYYSKTNVRVMALITGFICGLHNVTPAQNDCAISDLGNLADEAEKIMCENEVRLYNAYSEAMDQIIQDGKNGEIWVAGAYEAVRIGNYDRNNLLCKN